MGNNMCNECPFFEQGCRFIPNSYACKVQLEEIGIITDLEAHNDRH